jgi:23S rRNA (uracil-5-)-methyltransferase RumA
MRSRKLGQHIEGTIVEMSHDGNGIVPEGKKSIFVARTIPGERITATIKHRIKNGFLAHLETMTESSPHRQEPRCPHASVCGGCKWQHIDYPFQLELKKTLLLNAFQNQDISIPFEGIEGSPDLFYYRNRMDYVFGRDGSLGLKEAGQWWSVLNLSTCFLLSPETTEIMEMVRTWTRASGLPFWDVRTHEGFFRYLVIREGKNTRERMITLVTHDSINESIAEKMQELKPLLGGMASSILWGINPHITDLSFADKIIPLKGDPWIEEEINGMRYRIAPNSFFQTNTIMAARLQDTVKSFCGPLEDQIILDLYCGAGFFTLSLSGARKRIGIEIDPSAIEAAKLNAQLNHVEADFYAAKAEEFDWKRTCPQTVILDPPRAGLHPHVIKTLRQVLPKRIIYVSCNFKRCAEEIPLFLDVYKITRARALDLFPHTPHVELVLCLERI